MARVLITGKNGQLGQALIEQLERNGDTVIATDKEEMDITDVASCAQVLDAEKPEVLINTAAYNLVPACEDNPMPAFQVNTFAVQNLAKLCAEREIQFVTYSSDYVFDGTATQSYEEDAMTRPLQMYGISKRAGELACMNENPSAVLIRTASLYGGEHGSPVKGNFVLSMLKAAKENKRLEVGDESRMSPTYAVDLATATLQLLEKKAEGGIYHLTNEGDCSWAGFAAKIMEAKGLNMKIVPVERKEKSGDMHRPAYSVLNNKKARKMGVVLPSWEDAIERYVKTLP